MRVRPQFDAEDLGAFTDRAYREHGASVLALADRMCGPSIAAEVTQEVFLRLWTNPGKFDPSRGSLRTFLLTSCTSRAVDALRSDASRRRRETAEHQRLSQAETFDSDFAVIAEEDRLRVLALLDQLPSAERVAIVAAFYGDCTYIQAAELLGQPEGTVKSRIRRGLFHLRRLLAEQTDDDNDGATNPPLGRRGSPQQVGDWR